MIHESISFLQKYPNEVTTHRLHPALLKEKLCTYPLGESFAISYSSIGPTLHQNLASLGTFFSSTQ